MHWLGSRCWTCLARWRTKTSAALRCSSPSRLPTETCCERAGGWCCAAYLSSPGAPPFDCTPPPPPHARYEYTRILYRFPSAVFDWCIPSALLAVFGGEGVKGRRRVRGEGRGARGGEGGGLCFSSGAVPWASGAQGAYTALMV